MARSPRRSPCSSPSRGARTARRRSPCTTDDFADLDDWPGTGLARGLWIDAPLGMIDAYDLVSYSNLADDGGAALEYWYDLWNAGFCLPVSAGTDQCLGRRENKPLGGYRAYVRVPDPGASPDVVYDDWIEALRRGRSYVTSGPLLTGFDVGGAGPGETLSVSGGMPADVAVTARFESARNLKRVEVVVNGEVVETITVPHAREYDLATTVPIRETSWIAVRHDGADTGDFLCTSRALAHPTPVLVLVAGDGLTSPWTAAEDFVPGASYWWRVSARDAGGDLRWATSIGWWFRPGVSTAVAGVRPPPPLRLANAPNPFNPHTTIFIELAETGSASLRVYGVDGRLVRTLFDGARPAGRHVAAWDGRDGAGRDAPPGAYLLLLRAGPRAESRKIVLLK